MTECRVLAAIRERGRAFLKGVGSVLDLWGSSLPPAESLSDEEAARKDAQAIKSDWEAVGGDLRSAMDTMGQSRPLAVGQENGGIKVTTSRRRKARSNPKARGGPSP